MPREKVFPDHDRAAIGTWDASYRLHNATTLWGEPPVPFVGRVAEMLQPYAAELILDLPCGDGRNAVPLLDAFGTLVAADSSRNALTLLEGRLEALGRRRCLLLEADVFRTPFATGQFGGAFCCDLLGHLRRPDLALRELLRVCRPGGLVVGTIFTTEDSTRGLNMRAIGDEEYIYDERFYFRFYTQLAVEHLLRSIGVPLRGFERVRWTEPPHEGYRPYEHEHESWLFAIERVA